MNKELPPGIDEAIAWLMNKDPAQRPPKSGTAVKALEAACEAGGISVARPTAGRDAATPGGGFAHADAAAAAMGTAPTMPAQRAVDAVDRSAHRRRGCRRAGSRRPSRAIPTRPSRRPENRARCPGSSAELVALVAGGVVFFAVHGHAGHEQPPAPPPPVVARPQPAVVAASARRCCGGVAGRRRRGDDRAPGRGAGRHRAEEEAGDEARRYEPRRAAHTIRTASKIRSASRSAYATCLGAVIVLLDELHERGDHCREHVRQPRARAGERRGLRRGGFRVHEGLPVRMHDRLDGMPRWDGVRRRWCVSCADRIAARAAHRCHSTSGFVNASDIDGDDIADRARRRFGGTDVARAAAVDAVRDGAPADRTPATVARRRYADYTGDGRADILLPATRRPVRVHTETGAPEPVAFPFSEHAPGSLIHLRGAPSLGLGTLVQLDLVGDARGNATDTTDLDRRSRRCTPVRPGFAPASLRRPRDPRVRRTAAAGSSCRFWSTAPSSLRPAQRSPVLCVDGPGVGLDAKKVPVSTVSATASLSTTGETFFAIVEQCPAPSSCAPITDTNGPEVVIAPGRPDHRRLQRRWARRRRDDDAHRYRAVRSR